MLLTPTEAAKLAGRDPRTIRQWVDRGDVAGLGVRIGDRVFVRRRVLERLLGEREEDEVSSPSAA